MEDLEQYWLSVLNRISPLHVVDLDEDVFSPAPGQRGGLPAVGKDDAAQYWNVPSKKLWHDPKQSARSSIGVRVREYRDDNTAAAVKLAAAALERNIVPVILTTLAETGFERFGFRVERLVDGAPEEVARCEEELKQFWNMAIVIEADDLLALG